MSKQNSQNTQSGPASPTTPSRRGVPHRVTMTDVAREAGCSQATVSFVLNNSTAVKLSDKTRQRVFDAAQKLGYAMSPAHAVEPQKAPLSGRNRIGFIVDQLATSPEAAVSIESVCKAARIKGDIVLVAQTFNDAEMEQDIVNLLVEQNVMALVFMTINTREIKLPTTLEELGVPVYLLNCYTSDQRYLSIIPSELAGGQRSTKYLLEHGHRRIATITGEIWMEAARDRLRGYRRALASADIPFDPELVVEGDWSASSGYAATQKLLAHAKPPTAIFCQNDRTAIGCYEALKEAGYVIPRDMSVIGYDDEEISRHLHPQLTSSVLPHRAMGRWIVEQIGLAADEQETRFPIIKQECPLVERKSITYLNA